MKHVRLLHLWVLIALAAVFAAAACGEDAVEVPEAAITASDYSFSGPATIPGGLTRISLTNAGQENHHLQLLRLNDGVSQADLDVTIQSTLEAVATEGEAALLRIFGSATVAGGPGIVAPGSSSSTVLNLQPGEYALVCFVASPDDGIPHLAKGMRQSLTVGAVAEKQPDNPEASATVALNDYAFSGLPAELSAGESTIAVSNSGSEPHEMAIVKLDGITAEQLRQSLLAPPGDAPPGPPPFTFTGGMQAMMPGEAGWVTVNLDAGDYVAVCFVPSPAHEGKPHAALGMFSGFTVR